MYVYTFVYLQICTYLVGLDEVVEDFGPLFAASVFLFPCFFFFSRHGLAQGNHAP